MSASILVVDDDTKLQGLLARYLSENGFLITTASDSAQMQRLLQRGIYQIYILDINLPGEDGLRICQRLRASGDNTPIIMLTARGEDVDRIIGLEFGADDYLSKPFNPRELLARIRSLLRRSGTLSDQIQDAGEFSYEFGPFTLKANPQQLTYKGNAISLNHKEFALLKALVQSQGRPISRTELSARIYGRNYDPDQRDIDMMISRLRKHLNPELETTNFIQTVRGIGYVFINPHC